MPRRAPSRWLWAHAPFRMEEEEEEEEAPSLLQCTSGATPSGAPASRRCCYAPRRCSVMSGGGHPRRGRPSGLMGASDGGPRPVPPRPMRASHSACWTMRASIRRTYPFQMLLGGSQRGVTEPRWSPERVAAFHGTVQNLQVFPHHTLAARRGVATGHLLAGARGACRILESAERMGSLEPRGPMGSPEPVGPPEPRWSQRIGSREPSRKVGERGGTRPLELKEPAEPMRSPGSQARHSVPGAPGWGENGAVNCTAPRTPRTAPRTPRTPPLACASRPHPLSRRPLQVRAARP